MQVFQTLQAGIHSDDLSSPRSRRMRISRSVRSLLAILLTAILSASSAIQREPFLPQIHVSGSEKEEIHNGDVIFRKATGLGSQYILSVDQNSNYSHAGIIHKVGDRITVIQSAAEQNLLSARVREEPLESFLENIPLASIYRLRTDTQSVADHAVQVALSFLGRPFDADLDLTNSEALYCTELVWLSYKRSGIDLLNGKYDYLNIPIAGQGYYILPSSLVDSPWMYQVMLLEAK